MTTTQPLPARTAYEWTRTGGEAMKIIAFEEHYKSRAIEEANKGSPTQRTYDEWKKENRFQPKDPAMGASWLTVRSSS
jgi:hypothetical protein